MKKVILCLIVLSLIIFAKGGYIVYGIHKPVLKDSMPTMLLGNFTDDYGIRYHVTDSLFTQLPNAKYHIIKWNPQQQYLIAKNDDNNPDDAGLFTRIDYMSFKNMEPYLWGFCLTVYNAKSELIAEQAAHADRDNPKKGCGGFPFSRMKKSE